MRFCPVLIVFLLISNLFSQEPEAPSSSAQVPYVERQEKEFNFFPGGKIEILANAPGSLKIVGWGKGLVRMEAEKIVYYLSQEEAKAEVQKSPIRVRFGQTSSTIQTRNSPSATMEVNLIVYVPGYRTDVTAKMNRGDFSISGVNGWVEVTVAAEGSIEAKSMAGYFSGNTLRGDISVEMEGIRWQGLEFAAGTQYGSVNLILPEKYSAALQLETRNGKITIDYPPQEVEGEIVPPEIEISKTSQSMKASVGDGGAPVKLITYSGDMTLSKKE
jgi:DUF4097 and DUF4098 domain-containing protein YvlB